MMNKGVRVALKLSVVAVFATLSLCFFYTLEKKVIAALIFCVILAVDILLMRFIDKAALKRRLQENDEQQPNRSGRVFNIIRIALAALLSVIIIALCFYYDYAVKLERDRIAAAIDGIYTDFSVVEEFYIKDGDDILLSVAVLDTEEDGAVLVSMFHVSGYDELRAEVIATDITDGKQFSWAGIDGDSLITYVVRDKPQKSDLQSEKFKIGNKTYYLCVTRIMELKK